MNSQADQQYSDMPEKLKARLYPVVLDLFSKNDFHQVNMREISKHSGLGVSTIYRYYETKETLLFSILGKKIGEIAPLVQEHIKGLESSQEICRKILWVTLDFYDRCPGLATTAFITVPMRSWIREQAYRNDGAHEICEQVLNHGLERGELDPNLTPSFLLDLWYMYTHRIVHRWHIEGRKGQLVDLMANYFWLLWKSISI